MVALPGSDLFRTLRYAWLMLVMWAFMLHAGSTGALERNQRDDVTGEQDGEVPIKPEPGTCPHCGALPPSSQSQKEKSFDWLLLVSLVGVVVLLSINGS